jgi:hypothetical protein
MIVRQDSVTGAEPAVRPAAAALSAGKKARAIAA